MYNKLKTKTINGFFQNVTEEMIIKSLQNSFNNAFSTFPYIFHNLNSKQAIEKFNSGNCISLSIFIKTYLENNFNVKSFLIPATIPNKYKYSGYLEISHVAIAIPISPTKFYIADSAFYFLNPILLDFSKMYNNQLVFSKNIYSYEPNQNLKDYITIDKIYAQTKQFTSNQIYNKYQSIPDNTYYSDCYYSNDIDDNWKYFLIEILNPDQAITSFFINIRSDPFITTCFMDKNGVCKVRYYISIRNNKIKIEKYANKSEIIDLHNISDEKIKDLDKKLYKYFKGNLRYYIETMKTNSNS